MFEVRGKVLQVKHWDGGTSGMAPTTTAVIGGLGVIITPEMRNLVSPGQSVVVEVELVPGYNGRVDNVAADLKVLPSPSSK